VGGRRADRRQVLGTCVFAELEAREATWHLTESCCAMLCCATLCYATLCYAVLPMLCPP